jgi:hypothetical protein
MNCAVKTKALNLVKNMRKYGLVLGKERRHRNDKLRTNQKYER